jgi:uncharacterized protein (DUF58 family)
MTTAAATSLGSRSLIQPQALMSIRNLEFRARMVVEGFWTGIHRSPYHGFSVEFTEYRQYTPGDDPRYLDWKVFARSDRYFLKKFEDETNLRCHLITDQSRSMTYGSLGFTKAEYAATLTATIAYFLHLQGDAVGLLTFDEGIRDFLPAKHRFSHLRRLMHTLEKPAGGKSTDLAAPLHRVVEIIRKRALVIVISDFLAPLERLEASLVQLSACGHEVVIFQVLDPAEVEFQFDEPATFEDVETGTKLLIDPGAVRTDYKRKLEAHCAAVRGVCQKLGSSYTRLTTNQPLEFALFDFLRARQQRDKSTKRFARQQGA